MENNKAKKRRLITSALPYVNNVPHLGNLIQVLSADVYARFCRSRGYETLYVCGTDEYGTATETKAREQNMEPLELCTKYFILHRDIYQWFHISFDVFGRTSTSKQADIVQSIFTRLYKNGYVTTQTVRQFYSETAQMFLADRYIIGTCPKCDYEFARGDQCESCGSLLEPEQLVNPKSKLDNSSPVLKETTHLYIDLPKIFPMLKDWLATAMNDWSNNSVKMTEAWIRDGLKSRAITRDLKWGIPVPLEGFRNKVFYVWFDAPIGYISITATLTDDWQSWWNNPEEVELVQFIGKDNIPFHTVIFPSTLLGSGEKWTMLKQMSSSEYLNFEGGSFSKSRGIGVFGNDVMDINLSPDIWRFYLFYNRPESADFTFLWKDFQKTVNAELVNNLANLYNRTLSFQHKYFGRELEQTDSDEAASEKLWKEIQEKEDRITDLLEKTELRSAFRTIFELSDLGNKLFQSMEPWKLRTEDPEKTKWLLRNLIYLLRDIAILVEPFTPQMSHSMLSCLYPGEFEREVVSKSSNDGKNPQFYAKLYEKYNWSLLRMREGIRTLEEPQHLFSRLDDALIDRLSKKYSGKQDEQDTAQAGSAVAGGAAAAAQGAADKAAAAKAAAAIDTELFSKKVELRVAKIVTLCPHENADSLYVITLDDGTGTDRIVISGIRNFYKEGELEGRHVLLVANLKEATIRGVTSNGMLLGVEKDEDFELIFLDDIPVGTQVLPEHCSAAEQYAKTKIHAFQSFALEVRASVLVLGDSCMLAGKEKIKTKKIVDARVV